MALVTAAQTGRQYNYQAMLLVVRDHRGWSCGDSGGLSPPQGAQIGRGTETRSHPCPFRLGTSQVGGDAGRALIGT